VGDKEKKYLVRQCRVCSAHKTQSETRHICEYCVVPLHKEAVSKNIIH
jgi:hypothetical protein